MKAYGFVILTFAYHMEFQSTLSIRKLEIWLYWAVVQYTGSELTAWQLKLLGILDHMITHRYQMHGIE